MIGETMFVSGAVMFLTAPIAGRLMTKIDPRLMLILGFLSFAAGTFWMTYLTKDWDFWELFWPQVFRGVGIMIAMIPVNNIALGTLPPERVKNASGLFNLTRNLGGAVGLAALTTLLNDRTDLHLARLHEQITWSRQPALEMLNNMTQRFSSFGSDAQAMALKQIYNLTHQQGVVMAFADVFLVLTLLFVGLAVLSLLIRRPTQAPPSDAH
jgi:DHA2 family multidrug resistance protein